ncbi:MAG: M48 family metallopeptidase [Caldilineales bacterium]|nr:M48 family metallopeptidase [Caldilineales bacterium]MCW5857635.1 M48 family metallopeptidase [Caldilineales bacterium]
MKVEVIRSDRRTKTISARLEGETLVVRAPVEISEQELAESIARLSARLERKRDARSLSDNELAVRAQQLNREYFAGRLRWQSIRWVTNQERRYGSCTPTNGRIRISHRVATLPAWVQDYVIVHELAHLQAPNHGPGFWQLVNRYPRSERARGYLMALGLEESASDEAASDSEGG